MGAGTVPSNPDQERIPVYANVHFKLIRPNLLIVNFTP